MFEAELAIPWASVHGTCFLKPAYSSGWMHTCSARVTALERRGRRLRHLVEIRGDDAGGISRVVSGRAGQISLQPVSRNSYLGVFETPVCPLYRALSSTPCFLLRETAQRDALLWEVLGESRGAVRALARRLGEKGRKAAVLRVEKVNGGRRLTERQEQVIRRAYESGYFESPHATNVRELAETLDCSPSTLVRLLRKAEKKIVAEKLRAPRD